MIHDIIIVGAGVSGLTAALELQKKGYEVLVLDANKRLGGRIQTELIDGYQCDHGFQVLLPAYPSAREILDYEGLELSFYPKGALTYSDQIEWFGLPFSYSRKWMFGRFLGLGLKDMASLVKDICLSSSKIDLKKESSLRYMHKNYSDNFINKFLNPFFSGVFLDRHCQASYELFRFYLKLFLMGGAAVPKKGMQEIPNQIAKKLIQGTIRLHSEVKNVKENELELSSGEKLSAKQIVIACDQLGAHKLLPKHVPCPKKRELKTFFFHTTTLERLAPLNFILDNVLPLHIAIPTLIEPSYSKNKDHLCIVTCLGSQSVSSNEIKNALMEKIGSQVEKWESLYTHSILYALPYPVDKQYPKGPFHFCGDWTSFGSIEAAIKSGLNVSESVTSQLDNVECM